VDATLFILVPRLFTLNEFILTIKTKIRTYSTLYNTNQML